MASNESAHVGPTGVAGGFVHTCDGVHEERALTVIAHFFVVFQTQLLFWRTQVEMHDVFLAIIGQLNYRGHAAPHHFLNR